MKNFYQYYPTFESYMSAVDNRILHVIGLGYEDIPDFDYASAYEDEQHPYETAIQAIENMC